MYVTKIINQTGAELFANVDKQEDLLLSYAHLSPGFVLPSASFNLIQGLSCLSNIDTIVLPSAFFNLIQGLSCLPTSTLNAPF